MLFPLFGMLFPCLSLHPYLHQAFLNLQISAFMPLVRGGLPHPPAKARSLCVYTFSQHPVVFLHSIPTRIKIHGFVYCLPFLLEWLGDKLQEDRNPGYLVPPIVSPASPGPYIRFY